MAPAYPSSNNQTVSNNINATQTTPSVPAKTVEEPIYETRGMTICNGCGAEITGNTDTHMAEHFLNEGVSYRYHSETTQVQTDTKTTTISEQGHYEQVCVEV